MPTLTDEQLNDVRSAGFWTTLKAEIVKVWDDLQADAATVDGSVESEVHGVRVVWTYNQPDVAIVIEDAYNVTVPYQWLTV